MLYHLREDTDIESTSDLNEDVLGAHINRKKDDDDARAYMEESLTYRNNNRRRKDRRRLYYGQLCSGSVFRGVQADKYTKFDIVIEIKKIDFEEQTLSGYIILTTENEKETKMVTFFAGEIVGDIHCFETGRWGTSIETDIENWKLFDDFRDEYFDNGLNENAWERRNLFIRIKELYLDEPQEKGEMSHRGSFCYIRHFIAGISFDGFYYMHYNIMKHELVGYYYHKNIITTQKADLKGDRKAQLGIFEYF